MKSKSLAVASFALIIVVLFTTVGFGFSSLDSSSSKTTYIEKCDCSLSHGLVTTNVSASIKGSSAVTSVKIKMELQKLSGGSYSTIETWEQTFSGRSGSMDESKITSPLNTYRLKATVTAYSGSNSESKEIYAY